MRRPLKVLLTVGVALVLSIWVAVPAWAIGSLTISATAAAPLLTAWHEPAATPKVLLDLGPSNLCASPRDLAQSFMPQSSGELISADALLYSVPSASGFIYAELYDITGVYGVDSVPTGDPLAVSNAVAGSSSTGWVTFEFAKSGVMLEAGTHYALALKYSGESPAPGWYMSAYTIDSYSGNMSRREQGVWRYDATWSSREWDFYFRVWVSDGSRMTTDKMAEDLVKQYRQWLRTGELSGLGKTDRAAAGKVRAFDNMLVQAWKYTAAEKWSEALSQLGSALAHCDGQSRPLDFVGGVAQPRLCAFIKNLTEAVSADVR